MLNAKKSCIFDHEGFTYVANFEQMILWVITDQDEESLVTTLEIARVAPGVWGYRPEGTDAQYTIDPDRELVQKIEKNYEQFVNQMIVGRNGRVQGNNAETFVQKSLRKAGISQ